MIRAIFFDLNDTLIRYAEAERLSIEAGCRFVAKRYPAIDLTMFTEAIYHAYVARFGYGTPGFADLATLSVRELRWELTTEALRNLEIEPDPKLVNELIHIYECTERKSLCLFADTVKTLNALGERLPLGIITNGPSAMQRAKLTALELTHRFRVIVVDTEFGHSKPDIRIFDYAAQKIGLTQEELLFVGNSPEADVAGAVAAGWQCVWMNEDGSPLPLGVPKPNYTIHQLSELLTISPVVAAIRGD